VSRVQLALNVDDIDAAVAFYSQLFDAQPVKRRPGYANFALDEPALKLVLIENPGRGGSLNHLGVEVESVADVVAATQRFAAAGLPTRVEDGTTCCYALQDKVWVTGAGNDWEFYTVLADAGAELEGKTRMEVAASPVGRDGSVCCASAAGASAPESAQACCAG
jgi:catechol 2,3-dioxygenase-like lactoylglutathione lyase family enzyme